MTRPIQRRLRALLLVLTMASAAPVAAAHSLDISTLTLTEIVAGRFAIHWQTTAPSLARLEAPARYPEACHENGSVLECPPPGLVGRIEFPWLAGGESRVTVVLDWLDGSRQLRVVDGSSPGLAVYGIPRAADLQFLQPIARDYTRFGVEHILTGFDHLMFVLAITLLVRNRRALVVAITAFTLAHSLTLAASVLDWFRLPSAAVETTIALSIVLACAECLRPATSLARQAPWLVTFVFGLLHGLGFASALMATGVPKDHVLSALLFFNVGVELGQLGAIAVFLAAAGLLARVKRKPAWTSRVFVYAMGITAAYWSIERASALFRG